MLCDMKRMERRHGLRRERRGGGREAVSARRWGSATLRLSLHESARVTSSARLAFDEGSIPARTGRGRCGFWAQALHGTEAGRTCPANAARDWRERGRGGRWGGGRRTTAVHQHARTHTHTAKNTYVRL